MVFRVVERYFIRVAYSGNYYIFIKKVAKVEILSFLTLDRK